jgi:hypothetical protein
MGKANFEACQLWIEQRVEEELQENKDREKSLREIGRTIAQEVERVFEAKVSTETVRKQAGRKNQALGNSCPPKSNHQPKQEVEQKSPKITEAGGKREGAGRKKKQHQPNQQSSKSIVSKSFKQAYEQFFEEMRRARDNKWQDTSQEYAIECAETLLSLANIY